MCPTAFANCGIGLKPARCEQLRIIWSTRGTGAHYCRASYNTDQLLVSAARGQKLRDPA